MGNILGVLLFSTLRWMNEWMKIYFLLSEKTLLWMRKNEVPYGQCDLWYNLELMEMNMYKKANACKVTSREHGFATEFGNKKAKSYHWDIHSLLSFKNLWKQGFKTHFSFSFLVWQLNLACKKFDSTNFCFLINAPRIRFRIQLKLFCLALTCQKFEIFEK